MSNAYRPPTFSFAPNGTLGIPTTAVRANLVALGYLAHLITFPVMMRTMDTLPSL